MNGKIVTLGEIMMRLSCPDQGRFLQAQQFDVLYAGSEANIASALSLWGIGACHVTALPDHDLGKAAASSLKQYGVDTSHIVFEDGRLGVYFLEHGASIRSPKIIYDRFDSVFAMCSPDAYDWDAILEGATWFHWSGITPAISANAARACRDAVVTARKKGLTVSGDINYRRNLWQYGKTPQEIMPELIEHCDVVVAGVTDLENCAGITGSSFEDACKKTIEKFPNVRTIVTTERETISASHNKLKGVLWNGKQLFRSPGYDINPIVDRVGAGDAFMAGFVYATLKGGDPTHIITFATASGALKHTVEGDVNVVSIDEIDNIVAGKHVGKLLR